MFTGVGPPAAVYSSVLGLSLGWLWGPRSGRARLSASAPCFLPLKPKRLPYSLLEAPVLLLDLGQLSFAFGLQVRVLRRERDCNWTSQRQATRPHPSPSPTHPSWPHYHACPSQPALPTLASTFPSRIICFRLLISFFSSKCEASSFWGEGNRSGQAQRREPCPTPTGWPRLRFRTPCAPR